MGTLARNELNEYNENEGLLYSFSSDYYTHSEIQRFKIRK